MATGSNWPRNIRLSWAVDRKGYDVIEREEINAEALTDIKPGGTYIVGRGGKMKPYEIHLGQRNVFRALANAEPTRDGAVAFANKWGLLSIGDEMNFHDFRQSWRKMRASLTKETAKAIRALPESEQVQLGRLEIRIEKKWGIVLRAQALSQFCWLERFFAAKGGHEQFCCGACGKWLPPYQKEKGRPPEYCDEACKAKAYRQRKAMGENRGQTDGR